MIEAAITYAGSISEMNAAKMIHERAEEYRKCPTEENFNALCGAASVLALMPGVKKVGIKKALEMVKQSNNADMLMARLNGKLS